MSDLSRVEQLLRNALGEDIYEVTPQSRVEALLVELNELIEGMGGSVDDVQINGSSIVENGVANVPIATTTQNGAMSSTDKQRLDDVYADYSSALTALGVI